MNNNKPISGIFIVKKRTLTNWIILTNKQLDLQSTDIDYFEFKNLLVSCFDPDYITKILDAINSDKKLIIDFDKAVVKVVEEKDINFSKVLSSYFNPQQVENELNDPDFEFDESIYSRFGNL